MIEEIIEEKMIKEEIKETMKKNKMSYRMLASFLNVSYGHLWDMLNGKKHLQKKYQVKIKKIFDKFEEIKRW